MKHLNKIQSAKHSWRTTALSAAVLIGLTSVSAPVNSATEGKTIGDLEIYQAAKGGKVTIMMMLDTSGSMDGGQYTSACDIPSDKTYQSKGTEDSLTDPTYIRKYCKTNDSSSNKVYFFLYKTNAGKDGKWSSCGPNGDTKKERCNGKPIAAPSLDGYSVEKDDKNWYYYKTSTDGARYYDRLTRLKDAIFTLLEGHQLDDTKVAIGIGQ